MNSRSGVNESNSVNFSADPSKDDQVDSKDGIVSFPFDHIYACHSDSSTGRRQGLHELNEIEITSQLVSTDRNVELNSNSQFIQLTEQVISLQNQNNKLKRLVITHLDLIQQQNELITQKDKLFQSIKKENDNLKYRLSRMDRKGSSSQRNVSNPPPLVNIPSSTICHPTTRTRTSGTSQIMLNSYTELLIPADNSSKSYVFNSDIKKKDIAATDIYGFTDRNIEGDRRFMPTDLGVTSILDNNLNCQKLTMIEGKRIFTTKENKSENRYDSLCTTGNSVPALQKIQRNRRKTPSATATQCRPIKNTIIKAEQLHNSTYDDDKTFNRNYVVNKRSKMINTYSNCSRLNVPKKVSQYTGSLSDRLKLIDTTPTGEDPYQLGEADMREQSPIPKLMLQKSNHGRMKVLKAEEKLPEVKVNQYHLSNPYVHPSELGKDEYDDFKLVSRDSELNCGTNSADTPCTYTDLSQYCNEFGDIIAPPDLTLKSEKITSRELGMDDKETVGNTETSADLSGAVLLNADFLEGANSKGSRKRAHSTCLLKTIKKETMGKDSKGIKPKPVRSRAAVNRGKKSPLPGLETDKPYHTLVGDPDLSWYVGLDPDVKPQDTTAKASTVEVPRWREKPYTSLYTLEGTENLTDQVFEKRHQKLEAEEKRQLRWYMRRVREQRHVERLRMRQRDSWCSSQSPQPATYTIWPQPTQDVQYIEITDTLPVTAFGEVLPSMPESDFYLPWVKTSKAMKRSKRSRTLH